MRGGERRPVPSRPKRRPPNESGSDRTFDDRRGPVAPFSHAVAADGWVFVTGQMPTDPDDDTAPLPDGVEAQTRRVIENLQIVLAGAGSTLEKVVFARLYLTDFDRDYAAMNAVWRSYFEPGKLPARTCIGVTGLARGALVEIDLVAKR
ncbi:MAG: RidA family protein [Alphaproteobacteria bacterium]|nr:RidA family protein [Alphaproteobacteria bacterium]